MALRVTGYEVAVAASGDEALHTVSVLHPEAILLDVTMPSTGGLEVCTRLRAAGSRVPILMLTARDGIDDRDAGLDAGADDYLVKPFALDELLARVRALLRRSAGNRERSRSISQISAFMPVRPSEAEGSSSSPGPSTSSSSSSCCIRGRDDARGDLRPRVGL
jgi:DNA-binding response OmpR family regulator